MSNSETDEIVGRVVRERQATIEDLILSGYELKKWAESVGSLLRFDGQPGDARESVTSLRIRTLDGLVEEVERRQGLFSTLAEQNKTLSVFGVAPREVSK